MFGFTLTRSLSPLSFDGEEIETTPEHPFYSLERGWIDAGELEPGERIRQGDGGFGFVESVSFVVQPQSMYNLTVAEAHTFFVGQGVWLVHNANGCIKIGPKWKARPFNDPDCRTGCEGVADQIQELIGGTITTIKPIGAPVLGGIGRGGKWYNGDWGSPCRCCKRG